jgi:hypothetical protein
VCSRQDVWQANALVPALISIDLRAAECSTFTALSSDAKVDVCAGENNLIRASRGVAAHENAHRHDACPAGKVLFGNPCPSLCGKTRVEQIGQNLSLAPAEAQENRTSSTPDAAVVVLPKRMIVSNACFGTLSIIEAGVEIPRKDIDRLDRMTWRRRKKAVPPVEAGASKNAETRAKFKSRATIHTESSILADSLNSLNPWLIPIQ